MGTVVWFTGLPSSGKSTLAARVRARMPHAILLDGDELRGVLRPAPGYGERERDDFYATLAGIAALLAAQGHVVLVAATANRRRHRDAARALAPRFVEVHVATDAHTCALRDPKGLWQAASANAIRNFPGVDYEPPLAPDVVAAGGEDEPAIEAILSAAAGGRDRPRDASLPSDLPR